MPENNSNMRPTNPALAAQHAHAIWRADQMASYQAPTVGSGHPVLDEELPNRGWPRSCLIELLLQQGGSGEMQLLRPALATIGRERRIVLLQPPHLPQIASLARWGVPLSQLLWIKTECSADALWSAEQILKSGSCGALLLWQTHIRNESLRRLHLAAQEGDTVFWLMRPIACAQDASPAPLRLTARPASGGITLELIKRRGPLADGPFFLPLDTMPPATRPSFTKPLRPHHAPLDRTAPAPAAPGNAASALV